MQERQEFAGDGRPKWRVDGARAVLRLSGPDARPFLQDLVTGDVGQLAPGRAVYAALLTPQGKYLFDFILVAEGDSVLLDVASGRAEALMARLGLYRLRRKVVMAPAGLAVALLWGGAAEAGPGLAVPDPRDPVLGLRLYAPVLVRPERAVEAGEAEREALRVALAVPETGRELVAEETYILEAGFERLHGVDFRKGCYVGQEVTARMKHKAELRRGLVRVRLDGPAPPLPAAVMAGEREAGVLTSVAGDRGLALLRLDRAGGAMRAGAAVLRRE